MEVYNKTDSPTLLLLLGGVELMHSYLPNSFFDRYQSANPGTGIQINVSQRSASQLEEEKIKSFGAMVIIPRVEVPILLKVSPITDLDRQMLSTLAEFAIG